VLISLIGMPGGGKSTVGRQLAKRLGLPFVDSDTVIEKRLGEPIRAFFEREGEERFRDIEAEVIEEITSGPPAVMATGGGAVKREGNRALLSARTTVVYLKSTPEELARRLRHDTHRPLLQVADPLAKLRALYAERDPLYRSTAHFVVETGRPSVQTLVNMIVMQLELGGVLDADAVPATVGREKLPPMGPRKLDP
jgi:shikimate kinase